MPQLVPFYFVNQLTFAFAVLFVLIYIFSKYILPSQVYTQVVRMYITKLSNPRFLLYFIIGLFIFYF